MPDASAGATLAPDQTQTRLLQICSIHASPLNPRQHRDTARDDELKESIAANGLLQAILVRPHPTKKDEFEIVCGERRHTALAALLKEKRLAEPTMLARIRPMSDDDLVWIAGAENLQREDLSPLDEARYYAAMRKTIKPVDGKRAEEILAARVHKSPRTVFNRLRLLACTADVQTALDKGEIKLQQAQIIAVAEPKRQKDLLRMAKDGAELDWLKDDAFDALIGVETVDFDIALYKGDIVEDEENETRFFADTAQAEKLENDAVAARKKLLAEKWPWVEIVDARKTHRSIHGYAQATKDDPDAGALIYLQNHARMQVHVGVWTEETAKKKRAAGNHPRNVGSGTRADEGRAAKPKKDKGPARLLSNGQVEEAHRVKTQALRRGVIDMPKAALVLTILSLADLDGGETGVEATPLGKGTYGPIALAEFQIKPRPEDSERVKKRLAPLDGFNASHAAEAFAALMKKDLPALLEILAALTVPLIGSHTINSGFGLGPEDSKLAVAIAAAVGAEKHVATYWKPGEDYFLGYPSKDRLVAIARALDPAARVQHKLGDFEKMKKGELAKALAKVPAWHPDRFPELAFCADRKAMLAAAKPNAAAKPKAAPKPKAAAKPTSKPKAKAKKK